MPSPKRRQHEGIDAMKDKYKVPKEEILHLKRMLFDLENTRKRLEKDREHARYHDSPLSWVHVAEAIKGDMLDLSYVNRGLKKAIQTHTQTANLLALWVSHLSLHAPVPSSAREMWQSSHLMLGDSQLRKTACEWISKQMIHNTPWMMAEIPFAYDADDEIEVEVRDNCEGVKVMAQFMLPYPLDQVRDAVWKAEESFCSTLLDLFESDTFMCGNQMTYVQEVLGHRTCRFQLKTLSYLSSGEDKSIMSMRTILQDDAHPIDKKTWMMDVKVWHVMEKCGADMTRVRNYFTMSLPFTKRGFVSIEDFARFQDIPDVDKYRLNTRLLRNKVKQQSRLGHIQQRWQWKRHVLHMLHERNRGSPSP
ncbi:hypothetical protein H310_12679 [Aphanomyces invadans]|uniref:Uncharacterized protein n=1 Tax=Aphanomyces invadans TaxID=157072 RepID=A0A024TGQ7_9STRA|nr:hypothetical protein H310_12679 [Aphanomyces invadans]ETV93238.1 hypothetical protein H310_12679 [Aphanomyces invadans]|eukprot:XP_008878073.1 hypothetical protein H310_12679 [Aphanomyces invadans]